MKKRAFQLLIILILILYSCETELDSIAEWKNIPVVYGLLDPGKDVQYIRINKAFLGKADARVMADEADSLQYDHLEVSLENINKPDEIIYLKDTLIFKDSGFFSRNKNYIFYSREKIQSEAEYKLKIFIPEYNKTITANTNVFGKISFTNIFTSTQRKLSLSTNRTETLEWNSIAHAKAYDITIRFHYLEVSTPGDTTHLFADWKQSSKTADEVTGGKKMSLSFKGDDFYKFVVKKIKPNNNVIRLARKNCLDFLFSIGGIELFTYIQANKPASGIVQIKPQYSNISEGLGVFSCRFDTGLYNKEISLRSIDSLAFGQYTYNLGFADHSNKYYQDGE